MAVDDFSYKSSGFVSVNHFVYTKTKFVKRLAFIVKAETLHFLADVGSLTYSLAVGH